MSRAPFRLVLLLTVTAMLLPALPGLAAAAGSISLSRTSVDVAPDFASQRYADQWDYSNPEDFSLVPGYNGSGSSNVNYGSDGVLNASVGAGGWMTLVGATPGAIPYGRDGGAISIDAGQYTRFAVRMWSSRDDTAQVWWRTCPEANTACYGAMQFLTKAGWGTYDLALSRIPQTAADWRGNIVGLQINPIAVNGGRVALDWVRVYRPEAAGQVTVNRSNGSGAGELMIDQDTNPSNGNETPLRRDGVIVPVPPNGSAALDTSLLPAGTWWISVRDSASTTYAGSPITVASTPMPVVLDPDISGGADVHDVVGGSRWDFSESGDIAGFFSVKNAAVAGGVLYAQNGKPDNWDPQVGLTMPGKIDGSRFHRLTFKVGNDAPWGLQDAAGGGMMARFVWQTDGNPAAYQDLNDVVVLPGDQTISVDLATSPATGIVDGDNRNKIGWAGQLITSLRFDPNEDPSDTRSWRIDDVKLAQDDQGSSSFNVSYKDNNWAAGTVADIYVDRGAPGQNRTKVGSRVPVTQGVNTFSWSLGGLPTGTYWVLVLMERGTVSSSAFSTGPVQMNSQQPPPPSAQPPFGNFDSVTQVGSDGLRMQGWSIDPSVGSASSPVHLYVDGRGQPITANVNRGDVGAAYGMGASHGFDYTMTGITPGNHSVCVYAYRPNGSVQLGCKQITISADTIGNLDAVSLISGGVRVAGWSLDRSTAASVGVRVYVDGNYVSGANAGLGRGDIAAAYPEYGSQHGFSLDVPVSPGNHTICVYGIDQAGPGANAVLGCRSVTLLGSAFGVLDQVRRNGSTLSVDGWALDPRSIGATAVHVYVDGVGAAVLSTSSGRPDVIAAFPGYYSTSQGFSASVQVSNAPHQVCVFAVGVAGSSLMRCANV